MTWRVAASWRNMAGVSGMARKAASYMKQKKWRAKKRSENRIRRKRINGISMAAKA